LHRATLRGYAKLDERLCWQLKRRQRGSTKENHIAEETANGIVGPQNQYQRYFGGL
jgi:hypothetical protein